MTKIIVLGAGIVGLTTAHALGRDGHEVIVIDMEAEPARGTSFANGGQLAYSYVDPFPCPSVLKKLPGYMLGRDKGISLRPALSAHYIGWGLGFLRNCTAARAKKSMEIMLGQASASAAAMQRLSRVLPKELIARQYSGKLILAGSADALDGFKQPAREKRSAGFDVQVLGRDACLEKEPKLASWQGSFCGGLYARDEGFIDTAALCSALKTSCEERYGVVFKMETRVTGFVRKNGKVIGVHTDKGEFEGDAVIMCLGNGSRSILKTIGLPCPIYPMGGYSLTLPAGPQIPAVSITDPVSKLVFANFGGHVRIAGFLDANLPKDQIQSRGDTLLQTAKRRWPDAADYDAPPNLWAGYRPMTPSGMPIVGPSRAPGLYYNMGHGSLGLTLAAGSAETIAGLLSSD